MKCETRETTPYLLTISCFYDSLFLTFESYKLVKTALMRPKIVRKTKAWDEDSFAEDLQHSPLINLL